MQGVDRGPIEFRNSHLHHRIKQEGWQVEDSGDINVHNIVRKLPASQDIITPDYKMKLAAQVGAVNHETSKVVYEKAKNDNFVLSLGGDHSIAIGTIAGILKARPDTGIIWVDAHADINTPKTSQSGNIHGMCVSFLMKHADCENVPEFKWLEDIPRLNPSRIAYIGLRDLDAGEKRIIREFGIKAFTMQDVDRFGIGVVMERAIDHVRSRVNRPIHLSLDIGMYTMDAYATTSLPRARQTVVQHYYRSSLISPMQTIGECGNVFFFFFACFRRCFVSSPFL